MHKNFAAIDAKDNRIMAVGARRSKNGSFIPEGFASVPSRGFASGAVTDMAMATDSVSKVLNKLKEKTGRKVYDVYSSLSSVSIRPVSSSGIVLLSKYGRDITERDIKKCVEIGKTIKLPIDKEVLHSVVTEFLVDSQRGIKNPLNLEGVKLEVRLKNFTVDSSAVSNMSKCVSLAGFIPAGFIFSGIASAYRVLGGDSMYNGAVLLRIGEKTTEVSIFDRGELSACKVIPTGAKDMVSGYEEVNSDAIDALGRKIISISELSSAGEVFIIGEGLLPDNVIESLESSLPFRIKAGTCLIKPFEELPPDRMGYIGSLGIIDYLEDKKKKEVVSSNLARRGFNRVLGFIDRYF